MLLHHHQLAEAADQPESFQKYKKRKCQFFFGAHLLATRVVEIEGHSLHPGIVSIARIINITFVNLTPFSEEIFQIFFKVILLSEDFCLNLRVGVIDDSQEHVQQDKENKKDVGQEVERAEKRICSFNSYKVKVSKDSSE